MAVLRAFHLTNQTATPWLHLIFWLVLGLLNLVLSNWFLDPTLNIWRPLINHAFMALLFYVNALLLVRHFLERKKYVAYILLANLLVLATVPIRFFINKHFLIPAGSEPPNMVKGLLFGALATGYGIVMLSTIYQTLVNRYAAERKTLALLNQQTQAELQFLRAQINPHFLFNTLNNIYSLAVARSPKTADMVLKLSHLLRYVIYEHKDEQVPVAHEVEHIRQFIELFKMRSEGDLTIEFSTEGRLDEAHIEPMILIPMVENCFKHCDFDTNPAAFVKIRLAVSNGALFFETNNSKNNADRQKDHTGGVGLENIRRRLELQYPGEFRLETTDLGSEYALRFYLKIKHT